MTEKARRGEAHFMLENWFYRKSQEHAENNLPELKAKFQGELVSIFMGTVIEHKRPKAQDSKDQKASIEKEKNRMRIAVEAHIMERLAGKESTKKFIEMFNKGMRNDGFLESAVSNVVSLACSLSTEELAKHLARSAVIIHFKEEPSKNLIRLDQPVPERPSN